MKDIIPGRYAQFANLLRSILSYGKHGSHYGLTQSAIAEILEVSKPTINAWLIGKSIPRESSTFKVLLEILSGFHNVTREILDELDGAYKTAKNNPKSLLNEKLSPPICTLVNTPPSGIYFSDWADNLPLIHAKLISLQPKPRVALFGLPGTGKTALARAYVEEYQTYYALIAWINARDETTKLAAIADIGARLGWKLTPSPLVACREVLARLSEVPGNILLVYDDEKNEETIWDYLPPHNSVRIIITTNAQDWKAAAQPISITEWTQEIGARYLVSRVPRLSHQRDAAAALSSTLYHLPLALEHAATYCEACKVDFIAYNESFKSLGLEILRDPDFVALDYQRTREERHERTVAGTLELALRQASRADGAEALLSYLSLLAVDPVPVSFFEEAEMLSRLGAVSASSSRANKAIKALRQYSLVYDERQPDPRNGQGVRTIRLHGLVRKIVAARLDDHEKREKVAQLIEAIILVFPKEAYSDQRNWQDIRFYDPHARSLVYDESSFPTTHQSSVIQLLNFLAEYRHGATGAYDEALRMFERALSVRGKLAIQECDSGMQMAIAASHHGLGWLLTTVARYDEATHHFISALRLRRSLLGEDHEDTAETLHRLGWLCVRRGHYGWAEAFLEKVIPVFDSMPDEVSVTKAAPLVTMGWLYLTWGDYEKAEHYSSRAAQIDNMYGARNTVVAASVYTLATVQSHRGNYAAAEHNFTRALELRRSMYAEPHEDVANTLAGLGTLRIRQGRWDDAATCFAEALATFEALGLTRHPRYAGALAGRAELMLMSGLPKEAEIFAGESLAIRESIKSSGHVERAHSQWILARAIIAQDVLSPERKAKAVDLLHQAVNTLNRRVLPSHVWRQGAEKTLAALGASPAKSDAGTKAVRRKRPTGT